MGQNLSVKILSSIPKLSDTTFYHDQPSEIFGKMISAIFFLLQKIPTVF